MPTDQDWIKAGNIAAQALAYGISLIKPGASYTQITEKVEIKIKELGGECAFPPQMALNEVAAHFTTDPDEDIILKDEVVSLDVGVMINGAIGDTASSVDLSGKHQDLIDASREGLNAALAALKAGERELGNIGKAIEDAITAKGFQPVRNLSGHGLGEYTIHSSPNIPNYDTKDTTKLTPGNYAIEPFATTGIGMIHEGGVPNIFSVVEERQVRSPITRPIWQEIKKYKTPFTTRWLKFHRAKLSFALKDLLNQELIHGYPPLVENQKGLVSQAEHSILITEDDEVIVTTELKN
jgi:methionyl aminopeptidase